VRAVPKGKEERLVEEEEGATVRRRDLLVTGSAAVVGLLAACSSSAAPQVDAQCPPAGGGAGGGGGAAGADGAGAGGASGADAGDGDSGPATCLPSAANVEGPYYKAGAPENNTFVDDSTIGTRLILSGRVLDPACQPIAGAVLDIWQANNDGVYDADTYKFRGKITVGADGAYQLSTIIPGRYLDNGGANYRAQHVHFKVSAPGFVMLTTQLFFDGDPFLRGDAFNEPSMVVELDDFGRTYAEGRFDFVLARA
jgi:protocatechuate 3,4-dioxygenase beta subunit